MIQPWILRCPHTDVSGNESTAVMNESAVQPRQVAQARFFCHERKQHVEQEDFEQ